jgi:UDP:flavonoid glycosyltransferase YjiC (YdhE family)
MEKQILFYTLGTKGDLFPFLGIARELRGRGYPVHFIGSEAHRELCEAEGCSFESVLSVQAHERFLNHPDVWKPVKGLQVYLQHVSLASAQAAFFAIEKQAKRKPSVLVTNNALVGGLLAKEKLASEKLTLPMASVFLHPFSHVSPSDPAKDTPLGNLALKLIGHGGRKRFYRWLEKRLNANLKPIENFRRELGLPQGRNLLGEARYDADLILDLWPDWFCPPKPEWPQAAARTGFVDYDGPARPADHDWKTGLMPILQKSPIVFTMGSEMRGTLQRQIEIFQSTCRKLSRPGILISSEVGEIKQLNIAPDFIVLCSAPFRELFAHASMVLSHGGIGTIARALAAGKPMFIAPMAYDQFDNGYQIERLELGACAPFRSLNSDSLATAMKRVLQSKTTMERAMDVLNFPDSFSGARRAGDLIEANLLHSKTHQPIGPDMGRAA